MAKQVSHEIKMVELDNIEVIEEWNPRKTMSRVGAEGSATEGVDTLKHLAESIAKEGLLQPLVVHMDGEHVVLVAGFRRYAACKMAKVQTVPVSVIPGDRTHARAANLIENLSREDLTAAEVAEGLYRMKKETKLSGRKIAARVGLSVPYVAKLLKIRENASEELWAVFVEGKVTANDAIAAIKKAGSDGDQIAALLEIRGLQDEEKTKNPADEGAEDKEKAPKGKSSRRRPELLKYAQACREMASGRLEKTVPELSEDGLREVARWLEWAAGDDVRPPFPIRAEEDDDAGDS